ncbi:M56 family metallopeptidase [Streptosporangium subroseum]|uniref:M56 family metallopeptidase n=1 Tax=Streptosporangium subroseum TaxID=106412 RepID=UPI0030886B00|nr:M56 family metallopeptidase [Streptosporangium subroseum]
MHLAVYLPLLLPVLAALAARPLTNRLNPKLATWLLTVSAVVLAAASSAALALLALAGLARIPLVDALGHWSTRVMQHDNPTALWIALIAGMLLTAAAVAAARIFWRRARTLLAAAAEAACLPGTGELVVMDDPAAEAFAMPGLPGRIVVSTGMLQALDHAERDVLLAHERAHLAGRHYLFTAAAQLAAAANPLLQPLANAVAYTVERWADEHAAAVCGDRRRVARTVGKAALAATRTGARPRFPASALGILGRRPASPRTEGPVPRRVAALLTTPPDHRTLPLAATAAILLTAALCSLEAASDLDALFDLAHLR